jgi:ankyrin repeat protein
MRRRIQASMLLCFLLVAMASVCFLWLGAKQRQYTLNRHLIAALLKSDPGAALALVNAGADPNTRYVALPTPTLPMVMKQLFHHAPPTPNNSPTALALACGAGVHDDATGTVLCDRADTPELVLAMLRHGANIDGRDETKYTPLLWAADDLFWDTATLLLQHGANPNVQGEYGNTPLMAAAANPAGSNLVRLLLERDADVNAKNDRGWTALHCAVESRHASVDTVRLLLEHGADVNAGEYILDRTPLMLACMSDTTLEIVRLLLKHGASVDLQDGSDRTPLMEASRSGEPAVYIGVARLLLQHGARVNVKDDKGESALMYANHLGTVRLLLEHGANAKVEDKYGASALVRAVDNVFDISVISLLLAYGADPNRANGFGATPLSEAKFQHRYDIVALLKRYGARK